MFFEIDLLIRFLIGFSLFFGYLGLSSFMTYALKSEPFYLTSSQLSWLNLVGVFAVIDSKLASMLNRKFSEGKLVVTLLSLVLFSIYVIGFSTHIVLVVVGIFILFVAVYAVQPIIMASLNNIVPTEKKGTISSLYYLACLIGGSVVTYVLGWVWAEYQWQGVVVTCLFVLFIALLLSIALISNHRLTGVRA